MKKWTEYIPPCKHCGRSRGRYHIACTPENGPRWSLIKDDALCKPCAEVAINSPETEKELSNMFTMHQQHYFPGMDHIDLRLTLELHTKWCQLREQSARTFGWIGRA